MKFSDIIGHEAVKARLRDMVDSDRMPHALLLHGPSGVGKLPMARALAQYMHCTGRQPGETDSCGRCPACLQHQGLNNADMYYVYPIVKKKSEGLLISADYARQWSEFMRQPYGSWEDWLQVSGAGNSQPLIYVDESDEIVRRMNLSNYSAKYKIALIWLPERLQPEAANKLLKIIEEPFADTRFILVSNDAASILPTIFSRTQRIEMGRLSAAEVARGLSQMTPVDPAAAAEIASRAAGSLGTALKLVDTRGDHEEFAPLFQQMMRMAYKRDVRELRALGDKVADMGREKSRRYLAYCTDMVRENFVWNLAVPSLVSMDAGERQFSSRFAPFIHAGNAPQMMDLFSQAASDIARNANGKIVMFDTLLRLIVLLIRPVPA